MANILAELRQRQHDLKAEATALLDKADKEAEGVLSAEQASRIEAIKAESAEIDQKMDAAIAELDKAPKAEDEYARGLAAGWAGAVAVVEVCAVANAKPTKILGFVTDKKSADDVRKELLSDRDGGEEVNPRHSSANADQPVSWDKAVNRVNSRVK